MFAKRDGRLDLSRAAGRERAGKYRALEIAAARTGCTAKPVCKSAGAAADASRDAIAYHSRPLAGISIIELRPA